MPVWITDWGGPWNGARMAWMRATSSSLWKAWSCIVGADAETLDLVLDAGEPERIR